MAYFKIKHEDSMVISEFYMAMIGKAGEGEDAPYGVYVNTRDGDRLEILKTQSYSEALELFEQCENALRNDDVLDLVEPNIFS